MNLNSPGYTRYTDPGQPLQTRKLFRSAGIAYGLIFGLSFAMFTWGYDGLQFALNGADLAWVKLLIGLAFSIVICGVAGWLVSLSSSAAVSVIVWMVTCGVLGFIAGHIPFDGVTRVVWLLEQRLQGEIISAYTESAAVRTVFIVLINSLFGAMVGFVEHHALHWAWDRGTPNNRMSRGSWGVLLISVPLALVPALVINGLIHQPLRAPQQMMGILVRQVLAGKSASSGISGTNYRSIEPYSQMLSDQFVSHFVEFSGSTGLWDSAYVDVVFDNGFVLRCATSYKYVLYCNNISEKFGGWMGDLVHAGLYNERPWLDTQVRSLSVEDSVIIWLAAHSEHLSENFEVYRDGQVQGWIFIRARFDNGFEMVCRFREAAPIVVDQCIEQ